MTGGSRGRLFSHVKAPTEEAALAAIVTFDIPESDLKRIITQARREMPEQPPTRRGEIIGQRVDRRVTHEEEHYIRCPECGGLIDLRDLGAMLEHAGPLPHSAQDREQ